MFGEEKSSTGMLRSINKGLMQEQKSAPLLAHGQRGVSAAASQDNYYPTRAHLPYSLYAGSFG